MDKDTSPDPRPAPETANEMAERLGFEIDETDRSSSVTFLSVRALAAARAAVDETD